jgi:hypothetical protein
LLSRQTLQQENSTEEDLREGYQKHAKARHCYVKNKKCHGKK